MSDRSNSEWTDPNRENAFSKLIQKGPEQGKNRSERSKTNRFEKRQSREPSLAELYEGVLSGDRSRLARAITLIESNSDDHFKRGQELLQKLLPHAGKSIRIGITGVPGAGKSTFIEAFGTYLCSIGHHVAVLAVDPSSNVSGGSILGDKTRMEQLARNPHAYIRPSPSEGKLGGVHRKTREAMLICEAAGFDVILVETVGVGQSEVMIREMVDYFMLLVLTGAGDELQGMKKGIMELADAIIVHKADGANRQQALKTMSEYNRILHFLQPATKGWETRAQTLSSLTGDGIQEVWKTISSFEQKGRKTGIFAERRKVQAREWMYSMIRDVLQYQFFHHPEVKFQLPKMENKVMAGEVTVAKAVELLLEAFYRN